MVQHTTHSHRPLCFRGNGFFWQARAEAHSLQVALLEAAGATHSCPIPPAPPNPPPRLWPCRPQPSGAAWRGCPAPTAAAAAGGSGRRSGPHAGRQCQPWLQPGAVGRLRSHAPGRLCAPGGGGGRRGRARAAQAAQQPGGDGDAYAAGGPLQQAVCPLQVGPGLAVPPVAPAPMHVSRWQVAKPLASPYLAKNVGCTCKLLAAPEDCQSLAVG